MRITRTSSITMFFMRFPIDAIFVDAGGTVLKIAQRLRPWVPACGARGARDVIELAAGTCARTGTQVGDVLVLEDR